MWVTYLDENNTPKIMLCWSSDEKKQCKLMYDNDIDKQVRDWQKSHKGQPPTFYPRIEILDFISDKEAKKRNIKYP